MNVFELAARISLDTSDFEENLNNAKGIASKFGSAVKGGFQTIAKVGAAAIGVASTAVVGFAKSSLDAGISFDSAMSQVAATMGATVDEVQELRDFAQEMGATTAFSATQAAEALNYMALAGYDAETSMSMLPTVLDLAAAGGMELALASDMITDSQSALGLTMEETAELVDKMAQASSKSNTSVSELGDAILTVGGTAKNLKGGTTELATVLGILADNGIKGAEGGTALRNMLNSLTAPTEKAKDLLDSMGVSVFDASGNLRSMNDIFLDLNNSMASMTQEESMKVISTIFNARDMKSATALLANVGDRYAELSGYIDNAATAAQAMAGTQLDNLAGDITLFQSALEGARIAVSDKLTPTLRKFTKFGSDSLSKMTERFKKDGLPGAMEALGEALNDGIAMITEVLPEIIEAGTKLFMAIVQAVGQNLPKLAKAAFNAARFIANELLTTLLNFLRKNPTWQKIENAITTVRNGIKENVVDKFSQIRETLTEAIDKIKEALQPLIDKFKDWTDSGSAAEGAISVLNTAINLLSDALDAVIYVLGDVIARITEWIDWLSDGSDEADIVTSTLEGLVTALSVALGAFLSFKAIGTIVTIVKAADAAFIALNATLLANPIVLVISLIAGLIAAIVLLYNKNEKFRDFINECFDNWKTGIGILKDAYIDFQDTWISGMETIAEKWNEFWENWKIGFEDIKEKWESWNNKWESVGEGVYDFFHPAEFATGGIVTRPTLAVVGEAGPEAIVPLANNTQWIDNVAGRINNTNGGAGMTVQNLNITMEGMNISSDYDTDRFIERISERLEVLKRREYSGIGGAYMA